MLIIYRFTSFFTLIFLLLVKANVSIAESPSASIKTGVVSMDYLVGAGDILNVSVWREDGMDKDVVVKPDGKFTFPLVGDIKASGKTTMEVAVDLTAKLKKYIPNPSVDVSVLQSFSNKVYVIGKVVRPGEFVTKTYMDVLQVLSLSGGLTPYADSDDIIIIRRTDDNKKQVFEFDYDEVISGERLDMNIILKAGDTVVVP